MSASMTFRIAQSRAEVLACQYLVAEVYNKEYEVVFSDDGYDLDAKIEPWPHRYLMGYADGQLVAAAGLYLHNTYVERFGGVSRQEIQAVIETAGGAPRYDAARKREITKVSVLPDKRGFGYGRMLLAAAHSRAFLQVDTPADTPHVLVCCAKKTIWDGLWHRVGIRTRPIKEFPYYKVHELYRSEEDPMDSRIIVPEIDIPARWYDRSLPGEYEIES
ncbi:MAG TPA: GNAT family N-acetyltransferase [Polyangia bacterium]|nr:GNAT family N-acetyltransferase [Polyangia bacterium]